MKQKSTFLLLVLLFCSFCMVALAQTAPVTGKVSGKTGNALEGVTVTVKGTNHATLTDAQGRFSIMAQQGSTIEFSFVGMETRQVKVTGNTVNVTLVEASGVLEDVVVVGYGTQKKSVNTGSISSVKARDLEDMPISRIEQALQGRTSGVAIAAASGQPGSSSKVIIRGATSINDGNGANDPLYVVDGIIIDNGGIDYLNQNDIESIELLKDAATAAIYGTRAAAGVVMITTKKGKRGSMRAGYNGYYGVQAPARKLSLLNATEYATLRNEAYLAGLGNGVPANLPFANPKSYGTGTDWQEAIFNKSAVIQDHQVSVSGGGDISTYYLSFSYFSQDGIVATDISKYKRFTVRLNTSHKVSKFISFGQTLGYSHIKSQGLGNTNSEFGGPLSSAINLDPITPLVVTDPAIANAPPYSNHTVFGDANGNPYGISQHVAQEMSNPLAYIQTRLGNYGWSDNMVGNIYVEVEPIKGLKVRSALNAKLAFWGDEAFTPIYYLSASNANAKTSFYRANNRGFNWNWENTISYTRGFGKHNVTGLLGTGAYVDANSTGTNVTYQGIPAKTFDEASMNFNVPQADRLSGAYESTPHKIASIFGRVNYSYDERYLLTAIVRRDGSTRFGRNKKYGTFPSVSLGWVASREKFWPSNNTVNYLKVRGSYGVNGTDAMPDFRYESTIGSGRNYSFGTGDNYTIGYSPNAPENPDLKWEQTAQTNIGFEVILFKNFSFSFDYFVKKTKDMLSPVRLPAYIGAGEEPWGNVASMENKGFEIELGYRKTFGKLGIDIKGNASHTKNTVTNTGTFAYMPTSSFHASTYEIGRTQVGHPIASFYGFDNIGIFQTQAQVNAYTNKDGSPIQPDAKPGDFIWRDINGDGKINADDRTFIGSPIPEWSFGFTINATYRNFDMMIFAQGVYGNEIFNGLRRLDIASANWTTEALNRWRGEGTSNSFPRLVENDPNKNFSNPSKFHLSDGSYLRLKTMQIGYNIPANLLRKAGLQKARIYVGANNLLTLTRYSGFDPEIGGGFGSYGVDKGVYPQARSYMVGLNLGF